MGAGPRCCGANHGLQVNPIHSLCRRGWGAPARQWGVLGVERLVAWPSDGQRLERELSVPTEAHARRSWLPRA